MAYGRRNRDGLRETYDYTCELCGKVYDGADKYGNPKYTESHSTVYCALRSATRQERSIAATEGNKAEIVVTVHPYEYHKEPSVVFEGKKYAVISEYLVGYETLELTLGDKLALRKDGK